MNKIIIYIQGETENSKVYFHRRVSFSAVMRAIAAMLPFSEPIKQGGDKRLKVFRKKGLTYHQQYYQRVTKPKRLEEKKRKGVASED